MASHLHSAARHILPSVRHDREELRQSEGTARYGEAVALRIATCVLQDLLDPRGVILCLQCSGSGKSGGRWFVLGCALAMSHSLETLRHHARLTSRRFLSSRQGELSLRRYWRYPSARSFFSSSGSSGEAEAGATGWGLKAFSSLRRARSLGRSSERSRFWAGSSVTS